MKTNPSHKAEAFNQLHDTLKPNDTVWTVLRHASSSGKTCSFDLFVFRDGKPVCLTWGARQLLGEPLDRKHGGMKVQGNGRNTGPDVIERLGRALWPDRVHALKHQTL